MSDAVMRDDLRDKVARIIVEKGRLDLTAGFPPYGFIDNPREIAGEILTMLAASAPVGRYTAQELQVLLNGRDDFIVRKGLWSEFVASLPPPPSVSTDKGSRPQEAAPTEQADGAVVGDDGWVKHDGGQNPVPGRFVDIRHRDGQERECVPANLQSSGFDWWKHERSPVFGHNRDIIAYRILPQTEEGS